MAIDSTVGGPSANSYVAVEIADAYFLESFDRQAWADSASKEALLVTASRMLDTFMRWDGLKATSEQAMDWPRIGAYDRDGRQYASDVIPVAVQRATMELAYHMLSNGGLSFEEQSLDRVKVGTVDISFSENSVDSGIPRFVEAIVSHVGTTVLPSAGSVRSVPVVRV